MGQLWSKERVIVLAAFIGLESGSAGRYGEGPETRAARTTLGFFLSAAIGPQQAAEKSGFLKGTVFRPYVTTVESMRL